MVAHKAACHTLCKAFLLEISEDMVQILLMLEVLFTQDSEVEDRSSGSEPAITSLAWDLILFKIIFSMTLLE